MDNPTKEKYLKMALVVFGIVFLLVYPLGVIWPAGWIWHGGQGTYYFQMICGIYAVLGIFLIAAARNPAANRSLIAFTIWSSVAHAAIMAAQAFSDSQEHGHLVGDVPACWWPRPFFGSFRRRGNGLSGPRANALGAPVQPVPRSGHLGEAARPAAIRQYAQLMRRARLYGCNSRGKHHGISARRHQSLG